MLFIHIDWGMAVLSSCPKVKERERERSSYSLSLASPPLFSETEIWYYKACASNRRVTKSVGCRLGKKRGRERRMLVEDRGVHLELISFAENHMIVVLQEEAAVNVLSVTQSSAPWQMAPTFFSPLFPFGLQKKGGNKGGSVPHAISPHRVSPVDYPILNHSHWYCYVPVKPIKLQEGVGLCFHLHFTFLFDFHQSFGLLDVKLSL